MLIIILSWIYITAMAYLIGVPLHAIIGKVTGYAGAAQLHFSLKCITGLMGLTFISTLSCLFIPLGTISQLLMLLIAVGGALYHRQQLRLSLQADRERLRQAYWIPMLLYVLMVFVFSYLAYAPSSHHDDGLYYSTSIKWLQEYGTVKGIANINSRVGFNNSWHILQANFGFQYLHIGLFNDLNGLLMLLVLLYSMGGIHDLLRGNASFAAGLKALFMLPLLPFHFGATSDVMLFNVNFISSSSADIPACLLICVISLLFVEGEDGVEKPKALDALVILYSIWVCTVKLSSVPIMIPACYIAIRLAGRKAFRPLIFYVFGAIMFVVPWMVRNVLISGYLLFPLAGIDLFSVPWKVPLWYTEAQERWIKIAILSTDTEPIRQWLPRWLAGLDFMRQVIMGVVSLATVSYALIGIRKLVLRQTGFFVKDQRKVVYVITGISGIFFWLNQAPDFRFGYGFLTFYCIFFLNVLFYQFLEGYYRRIAIPVVLSIAALALVYYKGTWVSLRPFFIRPLPYRTPEEMHRIETAPGQDINIVQHEDSWNAPLPVANENEYNALHPVYMGRTIRGGFRSSTKKD